MKRRDLLKMSLGLAVFSLPIQGMANNSQTSKKSITDIHVIIVFKIKKEKIKSFLDIMKDVKKLLPSVDGCEGVNIYQDKDDKYSVTLVERWNSEEAHKKHLKHVVDSGDWTYISSHLSEDPKSHYYNKI